MEQYLQHFKSLRQHLNDHEDRIAFWTAEHNEQQTGIRHLQEDLESVHRESKIAKEEIGRFKRDTGQLSKLIVSSHEELEGLGVDSYTLSQASELLNEDVRKQSSSLNDKKEHYARLEAEARSNLVKYKEFYQSRAESLEQGFVEVETTNPKTGDITPGLEANDEGITDTAVKSDCYRQDGTQPSQAERRLRQIKEEIRLTQEALRKLESGDAALNHAEDMSAIKEEMLAEEEFLQTLSDHLKQLQNFCQELICGSCGHQYVIEFRDSNFNAHEATGENE